MADPGKGIQGWVQPPVRFGGLGTAPTVAHSDIFTASLPGVLAGPGVATTVARSDIIPIGLPLPWLTNTAPAGYLMLDGSTVSRTTYPALHVLMRDAAGAGTYPWGAGDGTTTFGLPDCRSKAPVGVGTGTGLTARALGAYFGTETHALTTAQLAAHDHGNTTDESATHTHTPAIGTYGQTNNFANESTGLGGGAVGPGGRGTPAGSADSNGHVHGTAVAGSGTAHPNVQPSFAWNWIIRAL